MRNLLSRRWQSLTIGLVGSLLVAWAMLAVFGLSGYLGWTAELFANFPVFVVLFALLGAAWMGRGGGWIPGSVGVVGLIVVGVMVFRPAPRLASEPASNVASLKLATWNSYVGCLDADAAAFWILVNEPDVIAFTEITESLHHRLEAHLRDRYPFFLGDPRPGPAGLAVYSRVPIRNWSRQPSNAKLASVDLEWPGGPRCKLIIAHPPSPTRAARFADRADVLRLLAARVADLREPVIVLGDFNSTWASKDFRAFCETSGLLPASGYSASWHAGFPRGIQIAIDHVMASSRDFVAVSARAGRDGAGSDHLPVMAEIRPRAKAGPAGR